ncbi:MAG: transcriptional regulator [Oscillospiraceae bacterium]|jgi:DNA-binding MarR family transcriptional regulator|nr:transcriptional regulator [Oscillospiraceae bacterium]
MDYSSFATKAFIEFNKIMSNGQKDMFENINRANKGELFVLHFLSTHKTQVIPSEISTALHATTGRISALLGSLEKKGQIEREIDKTNRRNIIVTITDAGRERVETEMKVINESLSQIFIEMGEADTIEFLRLIRIFLVLAQKHLPNNCQSE